MLYLEIDVANVNKEKSSRVKNKRKETEEK
jgi:hypothetical protein